MYLIDTERATKPDVRKMRKYSMKCSDTGAQCDFEVRNAGSMEELVDVMDVHARKAHGFSLKELPEEQLREFANKVTIAEI